MGRLVSICMSSARGTAKRSVPSARLAEDWGIEGDAHAGRWHRQVSLLSLQVIDEFRGHGADVEDGDFGENLIVDGIDLRSLPTGTKLVIKPCGCAAGKSSPDKEENGSSPDKEENGSSPDKEENGSSAEMKEDDAAAGICEKAEDIAPERESVLMISQIGKDCHSHCAIYDKMGDCIMPREGVFAVVLKGGLIMPGDEVLVMEGSNRPYTAAVITLSDKGAAGEREDKSGPLMVKMLEDAGYEVWESLLLSDDPAALKKELTRLCDQRQVNLIFTSGGTGFSERDNTPEATKAVCDRMADGISQALMAYSMTKTPRAMFSRGVSGIRKKTLMINLPGSPRAVREDLEYLLPLLGHGIDILTGRDGECGRDA